MLFQMIRRKRSKGLIGTILESNPESVREQFYVAVRKGQPDRTDGVDKAASLAANNDASAGDCFESNHTKRLHPARGRHKHSMAAIFSCERFPSFYARKADHRRYSEFLTECFERLLLEPLADYREIDG